MALETKQEQSTSQGPSDRLDERYVIAFGEPLAALRSPFAEAVAVTDEKGRGESLFALVCRRDMSFRLGTLKAIEAIEDANLLNVAAHGVVKRSESEGERYVIVLERPAGKRVVSGSDPTFRPFPEKTVLKTFLPALLKGLAALHERAVTHRALRPDNLFFDDADCQGIRLGECVTTPPGMFQPAVYEPIERATAVPAGRGVGTPACDYFALGVTLLALLTGRVPASHIEPEQMIRGRLEIGSFKTLTSGCQISSNAAELLQGLLCDVPEKRWGHEQVHLWLVGRRVAVPTGTRSTLAYQPFTFKSQGYLNRRALAEALAADGKEASRAIRDKRFLRWLERSLNDPAAAQAAASVLRGVKGFTGRKRMKDEELVGNLCLILDPEGPIRYRNIRATPDGMGPLLAEAMAEGPESAIEDVIYMLSSSLPVRAVDTKTEDDKKPASSMALFLRLRGYLRDPSRGFGPERCLYELNSGLPCQSPLVVKSCPMNAEGVLRALDAAPPKDAKGTDPVDPHIAAFIASGLSFTEERTIFNFSRSAGGLRKQRTAELGLLAALQQKTKVGPLCNLSRWLAARLQPVQESLRNRKSRRELGAQVDALAAKGDLLGMLRLVGNESIFRQDNQGYREALIERNTIRATRHSLEEEGEHRWNLALEYGRQIGVGLAYLGLFASLSTLLISRMS